VSTVTEELLHGESLDKDTYRDAASGGFASLAGRIDEDADHAAVNSDGVSTPSVMAKEGTGRDKEAPGSAAPPTVHRDGWAETAAAAADDPVELLLGKLPPDMVEQWKPGLRGKLRAHVAKRADRMEDMSRVLTAWWNRSTPQARNCKKSNSTPALALTDPWFGNILRELKPSQPKPSKPEFKTNDNWEQYLSKDSGANAPAADQRVPTQPPQFRTNSNYEEYMPKGPAAEPLVLTRACTRHESPSTLCVYCYLASRPNVGPES
jgi:hypothetical protein